MKNEFTQDEIGSYYAIFADGAVRVAMKSIIDSLKSQNLKLIEVPSFWGDQSPISFIVPEIRERYQFKGLEDLSLGIGDINFGNKPRTGWEYGCLDLFDWNTKKICYQLLKGIPCEKMETYGLDNLIEDTPEKTMARLHLTEEKVMEDVSPRRLRWIGDNSSPYVVSVNMACAYAFKSIPEDLAKEIQKKRHALAEKHDLFLGCTGAVQAQCLGYGVFVDAFTLIPDNLSQIEMNHLIGAVADIGELVKNYKETQG